MPRKITTRTCVRCESDFTCRAASPQRYCSMTCSGLAIRTRREVACANCGRMVTRSVSQIKYAQRTYCSPTCTALGRWPDLATRFWQKVDRACQDPERYPGLGPCWPWTSRCDGQGYGLFSVGGKQVRRQIKAHRIAYTLAIGPTSDGPHVLHRCDNPPCVRPDHLFAGTQADNVADMVSKGRSGRHIKPERYPVGSAVKQAVLTEAGVIEMRESRAQGESLNTLSRRFGVSRQNVKLIVHGEAWKHVGGPITNPGPSTSSVGVPNVGLNQTRGTYRVSIRHKGKRHHIHGITTLDAAVAARDELMSRLHP